MANIVNNCRRHVGRIVSEFGRGLDTAGNVMMLKVIDESIVAYHLFQTPHLI